MRRWRRVQKKKKKHLPILLKGRIVPYTTYREGGWVGGWMDERMRCEIVWVDGRVSGEEEGGLIEVLDSMGGLVGGWLGGLNEAFEVFSIRTLGKGMNGWVGGWVGGWVEGSLPGSRERGSRTWGRRLGVAA